MTSEPLKPSILLDYVISLDVVRSLHPKDSMGSGQHYFSVGRNALIHVVSALFCRLAYAGGETPIANILDFGCGYGRVARYLRAAFPEAQLDVTDLDRAAIDYCVENLHAACIAGEIPENQYDLIWLGSVFTHLPHGLSVNLLRTLKRALRENGVLIFTTHGRLSANFLGDYAYGTNAGRPFLDYGLSRAAAAAIVADYNATGFGYSDYRAQRDYGIAVATPAWYIARTIDDETILLLAQQQAWDVHQDVLAFLRVKDAQRPERGRYASQ